MGRVYPLGSTAEAEYVDKRFSTARARTARLGGLLTQADDDRGDVLYVLTLHGWTRPMSSIEAVEAALDRAEGRRE